MLLWAFELKCEGEQIFGWGAGDEQDYAQIWCEKSTTGPFQEKHGLNMPMLSQCRSQDLENSPKKRDA